jgi:microcystin-dependent protein
LCGTTDSGETNIGSRLNFHYKTNSTGYDSTVWVSSEGNNVDVNFSGNVVAPNLRNSALINLIYPVGSIYLSAISTNPGILFGVGTWVEYASGRTIIGVGTSDQAFSNGSTGGNSNVTLSTNQIPSHNHTINSSGSHQHDVRRQDGTSYINAFVGNNTSGSSVVCDIQNVNIWKTNTDSNSTGNKLVAMNESNSNHTHSINNTGGGQSHNNLPPYIVTYIWRRTA